MKKKKFESDAETDVDSWENVELPQADLDALDTCKPEAPADEVDEEEAKKIRTKKILNGYLEID